MAIKKYKPTTPSRRHMSNISREDLYKEGPEQSLVVKLKSHAGRDAYGHVSMRHQGGHHKRLYRLIDFKRDKDGIPGTVARIEYDPYRTAHIALINYKDGEKRYIIAPEGIAVGNTIMSGDECEFNVGNTMPLSRIPLGTQIHNIELIPGQGGKLVRSAGCFATLMAKEGKFAHVRMGSGEVRLIPLEARATIGVVGNRDHEKVSLGKAGRSRWRGIRPSVRGVAMNPIDHPMGGGEGRASGGHPTTPWGKRSLGRKTRTRSKRSDYIIKRRTKGYGSIN
ncbi:50S ribosomal protein L2 [bacterium]|nr:50S ribosomal protein L2 [bacterium]MBO7435333.1 50S ribosomal protein L2 [bacterium]MBR5946872.1 50S ribosomal protein L2 [bacterium]MBR6462346.1 50S ribosomal protein L2 [bacterium]